MVVGDPWERVEAHRLRTAGLEAAHSHCWRRQFSILQAALSLSTPSVIFKDSALMIESWSFQKWRGQPLDAKDKRGGLREGRKTVGPMTVQNRASSKLNSPLNYHGFTIHQICLRYFMGIAQITCSLQMKGQDKLLRLVLFSGHRWSRLFCCNFPILWVFHCPFVLFPRHLLGSCCTHVPI